MYLRPTAYLPSPVDNQLANLCRQPTCKPLYMYMYISGYLTLFPGSPPPHSPHVDLLKINVYFRKRTWGVGGAWERGYSIPTPACIFATLEGSMGGLMVSFEVPSLWGKCSLLYSKLYCMKVLATFLLQSSYSLACMGFYIWLIVSLVRLGTRLTHSLIPRPQVLFHSQTIGNTRLRLAVL